MLRKPALALMNRVPAPIAAAMRRDNPIARLARPLVNRVVPEGYTEVSVRSGLGKGLRLLIDAKREKYYWTGSHEPAVQDALRQLVKRDSVVWDAGGHIGFFALPAARLAPDGEVHVFEPIEANRERLEANIASNRLTNVRVHPYALAAAAGRATLHDRDSSLMWSLVSARGSETATVECTTLDLMMERLPAPDVIKIDVEEAEVEVLAGGTALFAMHAPRLIVEFTDAEHLARGMAVIPRYAFRQIDPRHYLGEKSPDEGAA